MARYDFASDNVAGAMPEVLDALGRFNGGFEAGYGADGVSARAADLIRGLLDVDAEIWFAASGTAANALTLAALAAPHEAVAAHEHSHVATDETGAPGFFGSGVGISGLPGASGRLDPAQAAFDVIIGFECLDRRFDAFVIDAQRVPLGQFFRGQAFVVVSLLRKSRDRAHLCR